MTTIKTNAMEINLPGGETQVQFPAGYAYFWVRNDSSGTIRISLSPNISDGKDGVISIPPGSSNGTMHGYRLNDLYISGIGKVMVMGTGSAHNPFRSRGKGGDLGLTVTTAITNSADNTTVPTSKAVKTYTDTAIADLVGAAPETLDTFEELAEAIQNNETVVEALDFAITNKADKNEVTTKLAAKLDKTLEPQVSIEGMTIAEFKTWFVNWWHKNYKNWTILRVESNMSTWINNWDNDNYVIEGGRNTQIIPLASYDSSNKYAKFIISCYDLNTIAQMSLEDNVLQKPQYLVTGIKGEAEIEYRTSDVNITQENLGMIVNLSTEDTIGKTVQDFKEKMISVFKHDPNKFKIITFLGKNIETVWDRPDEQITGSERYQITPIGSLTVYKDILYGRFILSSYLSLSDVCLFTCNQKGISSLSKITTGNGYGISDSSLDWNLLTATGTYTIGFEGGITEESHGPVGVSSWGILTVTNTGVGTRNPACIIQKYAVITSGIYWRSKWNLSGDWSSWYKISSAATGN